MSNSVDNKTSQLKSGWHADTARLVLPAQLTLVELPHLIKQHNWLSLPVGSVDFSLVQKADSAILSVLLYWAKQQQKPLEVSGLSEEMVTLIELYDLGEVFTEVN